MTVEEARAVISGCNEWIGWSSWEDFGREDIVLDGRFTLREVEAILTLMKHDKDTPHD